jgi:hypothetical protein
MNIPVKVAPRSAMTAEAVQLDPDNLEMVACWCRGNIKGLKLPRERRVIDFLDHNQEEQRVYCGHYVVREPTGVLIVFRDEGAFRAAYQQIGP